jgi:hypothetical protein
VDSLGAFVMTFFSTTAPSPSPSPPVYDAVSFVAIVIESNLNINRITEFLMSALRNYDANVIEQQNITGVATAGIGFTTVSSRASSEDATCTNANDLYEIRLGLNDTFAFNASILNEILAYSLSNVSNLTVCESQFLFPPAPPVSPAEPMSIPPSVPSPTAPAPTSPSLDLTKRGLVNILLVVAMYVTIMVSAAYSCLSYLSNNIFLEVQVKRADEELVT